VVHHDGLLLHLQSVMPLPKQIHDDKVRVHSILDGHCPCLRRGALVRARCTTPSTPPSPPLDVATPAAAPSRCSAICETLGAALVPVRASPPRQQIEVLASLPCSDLRIRGPSARPDLLFLVRSIEFNAPGMLLPQS
jgi:hypothetical protein